MDFKIWRGDKITKEIVANFRLWNGTDLAEVGVNQLPQLYKTLLSSSKDFSTGKMFNNNIGNQNNILV